MKGVELPNTLVLCPQVEAQLPNALFDRPWGIVLCLWAGNCTVIVPLLTPPNCFHSVEGAKERKDGAPYTEED